MNDRSLAAKLHVTDFEGRWTSLRAPEELDMQSNGMWLILLC
jgi:hypothetical protein